MSEPKAAENGRRTADTVPEWAVVDLFCGIGGLSHGFRQAGFQVVAGVDADETCRYAYETNNDAKFVGRPLEDVTDAEIRAMFPEGSRRILVGCAPCTPFSAYAAGAKSRSEKWSLVDLFMERIREVEPEIVSMENVTRLISFDRGRVFHRFVEGLECSGYQVTKKSVDAVACGVPQHRRRLVVLASRLGQITRTKPTTTPQTSRRLEPFATQLAIFRRSSRRNRFHRSNTPCPQPLAPESPDASEAAKPGRPWTDCRTQHWWPSVPDTAAKSGAT